MNMWLLSLGVLGIVAAGAWYVVLLHDRSPGEHVPFLSKGGIPQASIVLWLLTVMLSESFVVNSFDGQRDGFSIIGGVVVAFALSEIGRWWHNRTAVAAPAEPPAEWFEDPAGPDNPDRPGDAPST